MTKRIWLLGLVTILLLSCISSVSATYDWVLLDDFNRPDNATVGNGWIDFSAGGNQIFIKNNQLVLSHTEDALVEAAKYIGWNDTFRVRMLVGRNDTETTKTVILGTGNDGITAFGSPAAFDGGNAFQWGENANRIRFSDNGDTAVKSETQPPPLYGNGLWEWWEYIFNATTNEIEFYNWSNSTNKPSRPLTNWSRVIEDKGNYMFVGLKGINANDFAIMVEEVWFWNETGAAPPGGTSDTINMSNPEPVNNAQFNTLLLNINTTVNASNNFNATLYVNGAINQTKLNILAGTNFPLSWNLTFSSNTETNFTFFINGNDEVSDENTTAHNVYIDNVFPYIVTSFVNNSVYYLNNITGQFNFTDDFMVFSYNISIDGTQIDSKNNLNTTNYVYNLSYNISSLSIGTHTLTVRTADGHTATELGGDYIIKDGLFNNYLKYKFYDEGYIRTELKDYSIFDKWTSERKEDRYSQTFEPSKPSDTLTFIEESDLPIHIVSKPGHYNDHWIIIGNHWKDYVVENEPNAKVSIKKINDYSVEVTISGLKNPEKITFNSVGDLNIFEQNYTFVTTTSSLTYINPAFSLQTQTMTFSINKTGTITSSARLFYNNTEQSVTKTNYANYDYYSSTFNTVLLDNSITSANVTFYWMYDINISGALNETGSIYLNQTVYNIGVDNCSTYTTHSINFTIRNETSNAEVKGSLNGWFKVWVNQITNYTTFNLSWTGNSNYSVCISPDFSNYSFYSQLEYTAPNYNNKLYYLTNATLDNTTEIINLFLNGYGETTQVNLIVTDINDDPIEEAIIKVLTYDLETNVYKTTEILKTDTEGNAYAQLILNTEWYAFIIEVDGVIRLQTLPTKVISTTKKFRIGIEDEYSEKFNTVQGMSSLLTYTNATTTFSLTFSDTTGSTKNVCLDLVRSTSYGETELNKSCLSTSAGTILLAIPESVGTNTYISTATVLYPDGNSFLLDTASVNFASGYKDYGGTGIFVTVLIILVLILIGLWAPEISIVLALVGLIISAILGVFFMNITFIIALVILGGLVIFKISRK